MLACVLAGAPVRAAGNAAAGDPLAAQLRSVLALARSDSFYLVLDLERTELRLMLGGVALRTLPYTEASVAGPQLALLAGPSLSGWADQVWREGGLDPEQRRERTEIVPPDPTAAPAEAPPPPPTPEDAIPTPDRYRVRFAGGLDLEIRPTGTAPAGPGLGERLRLLTDPRRPRLLVRLGLDRDGAAELYRCLPPRIKLVVLGRPA